MNKKNKDTVMTREEAIELLCYGDWLNVISEHIGKQDTERIAKAMRIVGKALRPVSREQVEQMRGEWMFKPFYKGTSRGAIECQKCKGAFKGSVGFNFCPNCGAPMTDEAEEMVMERMEGLEK